MIFFSQFTWHASLPASPPAQKLLAGNMNIFSVTAFILRMHSASLTIGNSASRTRRGIGPAERKMQFIKTNSKPKSVYTQFRHKYCRVNIYTEKTGGKKLKSGNFL